MTKSGSNTYIEDLLHSPDTPKIEYEKSEIAKFYSGANVLVTGATGFMGKLLTEKLLRTCPDVSTVYIFVRAKKGKNIDVRFKEMFEDVVFNRLREERPNFISQVVMLEGDTGCENLGLSPEDQKCLLKVNVIFHAAANVRFDETLRTATNINIRGVKQLLLFAKEMPNLKAFVHVSTAFSHCILKSIDEKHYNPPIDGDKLLALLDTLEEEKITKITRTIIKPWPNTYAFTKAIAENTVLKYGSGLPTCIVRPSIIISTAQEPVAGWINNIYGATGVVVAAGIGLMRTLYCKRENIADIIPADYVISNIIAAAWDVSNTHKSIQAKIVESNSEIEIPDAEMVPIFNSVSSCQNPISWGKFNECNAVYGTDIPTIHALWYYLFILNRYLFMHNLCKFLLQTVPAAITDVILIAIGRKPVLMEAYRKINKFSGVIQYFSMREWRFRNDRVMQLWDKMTPVDRQIFNFNVSNFEWNDYFYYYVVGLRLYIAKDPLTTLDAARAKYQKLKIAHYALLTVLSLLLLWGLVSFIYYVWSFCPLSG